MTDEQMATIQRWAIRLFIAAIVIAVATVLFNYGVSSARADGCSDEGCGGYKDERPVYSHRNYRSSYGAVCDPRMTRSECRRQAAYLARRDELRNYRPVLRNYRTRDESPRIRYAASRSQRYDVEEPRGRSCRPVIEISGRERLGRSRALESARNAWRVEANNRHGFKFGNLDQAGGVSTDCNPTRTSFGAEIFVCSVRARPCSH